MAIRRHIDRLFEQGGDSSWRFRVIEGIARAFWVDAFLREYEEIVGDSHPPGTQLEKIPPPTPKAPRRAAADQLKETERLNNAPIEQILRRAMEADGLDPDDVGDDYIEDFGWYLGMSLLGHGVNWFDNHEDFPFEHGYASYEFRTDEEDALLRRTVQKLILKGIPD